MKKIISLIIILSSIANAQSSDPTFVRGTDSRLDTTANIITRHKLDSLYNVINTLRGQDTLRAKAREGLKVDTSDSRLTNARTPTSHNQAITTITNLSDSLGNKVNQNDGRLTDSRAPSAHTQAITTVTGLQDSLSNKNTKPEITTLLATKETANANIQSHISSAHAPSNAQKNSDITKAEIESKLTGELTSHTHAGGAVDSSIVMTQTQRGADSARAIVREGLLSGGWTEIQRSADTTLNAANVTFVNLGELSFAMAANGVYEIVARIWFTKATDASAYTLALNCGGTPTNIGLRAEGGGSATDGTDQLKTSYMTTATDSLQLTAATVGNGKLEHVQIDGQIINENASNIFQFRFHQEIASSGVTIKRGSYLRYRRLY